MLLRLYVRVTTALAEDDGVTAVEYGIIVAVIALAVAAGAQALGPAIRSAFVSAAGQMGS